MPFSASSCWCRIRHSELMGNCLSLLACWQVATKEWILYVFTVAYKRWSFVNMMLHYGKKSLFWSLNIFGYLSFTTVRGQKIVFNSCEFIKFLNIANYHVFHVWGKRILSCNDTTFILHFFSFFCFATQLFATPVTSLNLRIQAPLFTELRLLQATVFTEQKVNEA